MGNVKIDEESTKKLEKLPLVLRIAATTLINCLNDLINGKCDEEEVASVLNTMKDNSSGRFREDELLNYDKAGKILGFGTTNRVGLKKFLDNNNVKQVKFGSTKVGFPKLKIMKLIHKTNKSSEN